MILDRDGFGFWNWVAKRAFKATFTRPDQTLARERLKSTLMEREVAIYIHFPFCKGICRFCPYVKTLWNPKIVLKYIEALKAEIRAYGELLKDLDFKIVDIHVGGGTPSLLDGQQFGEIMDALVESFDLEREVLAIEANPNDLVDESRVYELLKASVNEVSLGVQSFDALMLRKLGRRHTVEDSLESIEILRDAGLDYLNIDLMYMIPGQTLDNWLMDLEIAAEQDVDEVTCYPTLITPQCPGYKALKKGDIEQQPDKTTFKKMIKATYEILEPVGYESVEIYGFSRREGWKYATVNYEMEGPLLAFGCGAMGFTGGYEYVNTCSVREYVRALAKGRLPIAGAREVSIEERAARYTACRLFVCKELDLKEFKNKFEEEFSHLIGRTGLSKALWLLRLRGIVKKEGERLKLMDKGLLTAHMQCWSFVLNVPCRIAEEYSRTPWPLAVTIP